MLALLEREELAVQEVMDVLGMAQSRVSRHLGILREAGLLRDRREGTHIFYRFRPDGDNPEQSLHEVMFMIALPEGADMPEPAKCTFLDIDDDYTVATEIGSNLAKIFNQDYVNHRMVQKGIKSHPKGETIIIGVRVTFRIHDAFVKKEMLL